MKFISRLEDPDESPLTPQAFEYFRNAAALALFFSHDTAEVKAAWAAAGLGKFGEWETQLVVDLRAAFFSDIFVDRDEIDDVKGLMKLGRLVVVRGARGCGKSTGLLRIFNEFPSGVNQRIFLIDFRIEANDPSIEEEEERGEDVDDGKERETVCDIIYRRIFDAILGKAVESDLDRWRTYLILNSQAFFEFRQFVVTNVSPAPKTEVQWLGEFLNPAHKDRAGAATDAFSSEKGTSRLYFLLRFLLDAMKIECTILIDNIDRLSLRLQQAVVNRAMDLASVVNPVVAVRNSNYHRLNITGCGDLTFIVKAFRDDLPRTTSGHPNPEGSASDTISDLGNAEGEDTDLSADAYLLERFMTRRMRFARQAYQGLAETIQVPEDAFRSLGYGSSRELVEEHLQVLRRMTTGLMHANTIAACLRWHNGSLRTSASHVFNLINKFVMNSDPFFSFAEILSRRSGDSTRRPNARQLRSLTYRHFLFSGARPTETKSFVCNVFASRESCSGTRALYFLPLKILEFLSARAQVRCTWGLMARKFASFGVDKEVLFSGLDALAGVRGSVPDGLVYVDVDPAKRALEMDENVAVELVPAGEFFLDTLSCSCEFLFWAALHTDTDVHLLDDLVEVERGARPRFCARDVRSDLFRAEVALRFLAEHILPLWLNEHAYEREPDGQAERKFYEYWKCFGRGGRGLYPDRAAGGLQGFISRATIKSADRSRLWIDLEKIRDACAKVSDL